MLGKYVFGILYWSPSESIYSSCVSVYFICVTGTLVWSIQVQFVRKNFSHEIMTKRNDFFWTMYVWQQYPLESGEDRLR